VTSIDFYFNAQDRFQVTCRLAGKALSQKKRMLIYAPEPEAASRIDKLLWTWPAIGFVPHCALRDPLAAETPILIASDLQTASSALSSHLAECELILNLGAGCPPHFERFERLLEVVPTDEGERQAGRERYRFYQGRGYKISSHDLAAANE
jgi:DNA polymerase-3 subunit chi